MSVPFFADFTKSTKDFFKNDKFDIGRVVQLKAKPYDDIEVTGKTTQDGERFNNKLTVNLKRSFGTVEFIEDFNKGISTEVKLPRIYRNFDFKSKHTNNNVEVKLDYKPEGSYYNARLEGSYEPEREGNRICLSTLSVAVGDDSLNLSVGGQVTIEDKASVANPTSVSPNVKSYKLGFLYTPSNTSNYSVIYTPDPHSTGLEYSFSALKKLNDDVTLVARAEGRVDTKLTANAPVVSLAGQYRLGDSFVKGFMNNRREYGLTYEAKINPSLGITFGLASFLDRQQRANTKFGYKVALS